MGKFLIVIVAVFAMLSIGQVAEAAPSTRYSDTVSAGFDRPCMMNTAVRDNGPGSMIITASIWNCTKPMYGNPNFRIALYAMNNATGAISGIYRSPLTDLSGGKTSTSVSRVISCQKGIGYFIDGVGQQFEYFGINGVPTTRYSPATAQQFHYCPKGFSA